MKTLLLSASLATISAFAVAQSPDTTQVYPLTEVVVTGSNSATGRDMLPYTVSIVGSQRLEGSGHTQLLSALGSQVPSLFVSERNVIGYGVSTGGSGGIKIRGVGGQPTNAVLMMVDGQPQFAGIYSHHVADVYETEYIERVEVLRGPASVLYGSNAMGGVINVITRGVAQDDHVRSQLMVQYGSYNTLKSALTNTIRSGRFSSLVSVAYDRTDGVQNGLDFTQPSAYAKLGYDFSEHLSAKADYQIMHFVGNDPVYPRLSNPESTDVYHQNVTRGEASVALTNTYGSTNGTARIYYSYGNHYIDDPRHFHSLDDRFGILVYQNFTPWAGAAATVGFDFDTYTGQIPISGGKEHTPGSLSTLGHKSITEYSPYLTLSHTFAEGLLVLNGGLRVANSDFFQTELIPQLGFVLRPLNAWSIKGSVAEGYRNPSFKELYLYKMANPDLDPEKMLNTELTSSHRFGSLASLDLTVFYSRGRDMIQTVEQKNVNTGSFRNKGFELSAVIVPTECLTLRAAYSYLHTSLTNLTAAPKNQCSLSAQWRATRHLLVDTELRGIGGLYVAPTVENQNYAVLNVRSSYTLCRALDVTLNLANLTDARYVINRGYDMPGFNAHVGLKCRF